MRLRLHRPLPSAGRLPKPTNSGEQRRLLQTQTQTSRSTAAHEAVSEDEKALRDVFDQPTQTTLGSRWYHQGQPTGLLMEERFVSPKSFRKAGEQAIREAQALVERVLAANTAGGRRLVIKCLDQLSDALCRVMDVAELVRQVHPDTSWRQAADDVYSTMFDYMNGLNTHVGLYQSIVDVMEDPEISSHFTPVEHATGLSFRRDFERSGIHLNQAAHSQFVKLSAGIHDQSRLFMHAQAKPVPNSHAIDIPLEDLRSLQSNVAMHILQSSQTRKRKDGTSVVRVVPDDYVASYILRDCTNEATRRAVYSAWQRGSPKAIGALESLLEQRQALATTVGFASFGHMALDDKMARSPDHVSEFLQGLANQARPRWSAVAASLDAEKRAPAYPWDRDFLISQQQASHGALPSLMPYFSLGRVVLGLSRVFRSLYGVELRAAVPQPGEIWHPDVRKLEVVDEQGRLMGLVYCDVFARESKAHVGAAHFTARCARRVDNDLAVPGSEPQVIGHTVVERDGERLQLPVVVLICDFSAPSPGDSAPPLLSWSNVETIFHEMGHAMHSMLGQTGFHNVAGTRCPVDFVELPSILMEHFARSPHVLSLFASHHKSNAPLPLELLQKHTERREQYAALDLNSQLFMSALDQRYHSQLTQGSAKPGWSTRVLAEVRGDPMFSGTDSSGSSAGSLFAHVEGTQWQSRFTHLIGYGASYYAYLFDRVLAGRIWERVFRGDHPNGRPNKAADGEVLNPLNREAGERFKNEVLRWGGGRDPWISLARVLDNGNMSAKDIEAISQGNRSAMRIVGSWHLSNI
ncbi:Mitochondrial intermediate peptidase [Coemansia sp. Benny D115]|nr:Mitochondrial intermediate peptidase [Coemansia sp. Benny D115]